MPPSSAGSRTASGSSEILLPSQASMKPSGGVISAVVETVSTTPERLCVETTQ